MAADSNPTNPYAEDDLLVRADAVAVRSRADRDNPYAAPDVHLSDVDEHSLLLRVEKTPGLIDAWRDGDLMVVTEPGRLPESCLHCGCFAENMRSHAVVPIKPQNANGGWVIASICSRCWRLHHWGEFDYGIGSCCLILASLFVAWSMSFAPFSKGHFLDLVLLGPLGFLFAFWLLRRAKQRVIWLAEVSKAGEFHWLRGAKPAFLDRLPLFPRK